jgi:hypothetical protein
MDEFNGGCGRECGFPVCLTGGTGEQHQQRSNTLALGFGSEALTGPTHVVCEHLVEGSRARLIQAVDLALEFDLDGGQHYFGQ